VNELPTSALEGQVEALLQRVEKAASERRAQLSAETDSQVGQILRSGWAEARASVHRAVVQERARLAQGVRQASAQAALLRRQHEQRRMRALLDKMWEELPGLLTARWRDPALRHAWIDAAFRAAGALIAGRPWRIEHGEEWPAAEQAEIEKLAVGRGAGRVEWGTDPSIAAGLRIRAEGVCLAATGAGLLARREDIESAFLFEYFGADAEAASQGSPPASSGEGPRTDE
jgi:hypothetical protein